MQGSYTVQRAVKAVTFGQCVSTPGRSSGRQAAAISAARRAFDLAAPVLRSVRKAHRPLDESSERWRDGFVFDVSNGASKRVFAQIVDGAKIEPAIGIYHARCSLNR